MKEMITDRQIKEFLQNFTENSQTILLEEGKEKDEILEIAEARGIKLKGSKDLAGFKTIYTFANEANKNNARLPKKALLKALPSLVGKPVDIDHIRSKVIGHYIDYRYIVKDDMVVAYGVFYKGNFAEEWEQAQKLFKSGKLATSYEIWCPQNKRKYLEDGTYELLEQEIAGGALLFKTEPAFEDAKVLEIAKANIDKQSEDLVYASYNNEDIIIAGESILETVKVEVKKEEQVPNIPKVETVVVPKIKCANCQHEFEAPKVPTSEIKCSECFAIINDKGELLYPPQIIDFNITCPSCSSRNWRLIKKEDKKAEIKCLSCAKNYGIEFSAIEKNELLEKIQFLHEGTISCKQCGNLIVYSGSSHMKKYDVKCRKCGLAFSHDVTHEQIKKLSKIEEITSKADELKIDKSAIQSEEAKGEVTMEKQEEKVVEQKPVEASVVETPKVESTPQAESVIAEAKPVEAKVEETPKVEEKKEEPKPEEAKVEETKKEETPKIEAKPEEAKVEETPKVEEKPIEEAKKEEEKKEEETEEQKKWKKWSKGVRKMAKKVKGMRKQMKEKEKECASLIEFYKANAEEISKRRKELGEEGKVLSDLEILDNTKYSDVKLVKANKDLEQGAIAGVKTSEHSEEWYAKHRKEIDDKAFGRKERIH